jgi:hypothetical protein
MNIAQNRRLHKLLHETGLMEHKKDLVRQYTNGRSASSKDLTFYEALELEKHLRTQLPKVYSTNTGAHWTPPEDFEEGFQRNIKKFDHKDPKNSNESRTPMRNYIKHLCHLMGLITRSHGGQYPYDYSRMNHFIENLGSNNPRKVHLHLLSWYELKKVTAQVEQVYRKEMTRFSPTKREMELEDARKKFLSDE